MNSDTQFTPARPVNNVAVNAASAKPKKKYTLRKLINDVHLWLGLSSGLILFVVCLSGTVYTFHSEVEQFMEPEKFYVSVPEGQGRLSADALIAKLEADLNGKVTAIEIPADAAAACKVSVAAAKPAKVVAAAAGGNGKPLSEGKPQGEAGKKAAKGAPKQRPKTYYVNPYTGAITGQGGGKTAEFFTTVMKLHRWLLIEGGTGRIIVGSATIIFVLLTLTGLILWFPARLRYWKQGLKIMVSGNWKRLNHDLHNTLGFYSFILLLIMGLTGLCWSFDWYRDGVSAIMGDKVFKGRGEKPLPSKLPAAASNAHTVAYILSVTDNTFPYKGDVRISLPEGTEGTYVVSKYKSGFFAPAVADKLQVDQYSGTPLKVERFADKKLNEKIVASIRPLHLGDIYGTFSKILYFIACLIATSLPVTGTMIWINKLKKKSK